jgi:CheY-like chemotaxis protein
MTTALLTSDLMISSQASATASRGGAALKTFASSEQLIAACADGGFDHVIVDLAMPGIDLRDLVSELNQQAAQSIRITAFGPHVQEATLQSAQAAGCHQVLTRGQFHANMEDVVSGRT